MKGIVILLSLIFTFTIANGQTQIKPKAKFSKEQIQPDKEVEAMKKAEKAPVLSDFTTEEEYLKAKEKWVKNNRKAYEKIIGLKDEKETKPEE